MSNNASRSSEFKIEPPPPNDIDIYDNLPPRLRQALANNQQPAKLSPDDSSSIIIVTEQELTNLLVSKIEESQRRTRYWALTGEKEELK